MRPLLALLCAALLAAGCGPVDATQSGGERARPTALLTVLPSPGELRGPPAAAADPDALARAFSGAADPALAEAIADRAPSAAATRGWRAPDGGTLTAAVSVWDSHLTATQVGADLAGALATADGSAWTPRAVPGSRGARRDDPARRELRLAYAVGPNALYVRSTGPVDDATVERALNRLIDALPGALE